MATATKTGMLLARACCSVQSSLFKESQYMPSALTQLQFVRERRRTCRPPKWFVPKKASPHHALLTPENKSILKEMIVDNYTQRDLSSPLKEGPWERNEWTTRTMRTGVLAVKIGVIPQWTKSGKKFYTTLLQVLDNHVINYVPPEEYVQSVAFNKKWHKKVGMVVVGALSSDPMIFTKRYNNLFAEAGVPPKRKLTRFLVTPDAAIQAGTPLNATHFRVGDYVDVQAKTIGHGFQGVVKRWGFKGGPASHGATKFSRRPGSSSGGSDKAAIWKGKKMPGHMGMDWRTLMGLRIWRINTKYNVLYVHGHCLPGPTHCYVRVMDSKLVYRKTNMLDSQNLPPMPTFYPEDAPEPLPEELFDDNLHHFSDPTISFVEQKS